METAVVAGENHCAVRIQMHHACLDEIHMVALHVERLLAVLAVAEGGRVAEYQVEPVIGVIEELHHIALVEEVVHRRKPIEPHVLLGPIKVGCRSVNADSGKGSPFGCLDRGAGGVAEEIEESFPFGHGAYLGPDGAVVKEKASIQVVVEVDQELASVLMDDKVFAGIAELHVLLLSALPGATLHKDVLRVDLGGSLRGVYEVLQPACGILLGNFIGGLILAEHNPFLFIHVDCGVELRHVRIIDPIAGDSLLFHQWRDGIKVFLQPVEGHLCVLVKRLGKSLSFPF